MNPQHTRAFWRGVQTLCGCAAAAVGGPAHPPAQHGWWPTLRPSCSAPGAHTQEQVSYTSRVSIRQDDKTRMDTADLAGGHHRLVLSHRHHSLTQLSVLQLQPARRSGQGGVAGERWYLCKDGRFPRVREPKQQYRVRLGSSDPPEEPPDCMRRHYRGKPTMASTETQPHLSRWREPRR